MSYRAPSIVSYYPWGFDSMLALLFPWRFFGISIAIQGSGIACSHIMLVLIILLILTGLVKG